ncbi:uncharacterized protein LOC135094250 [Scylla paramamosain]
MWGSEDLTHEARGVYEAFDCAQAVALIAFIGLLSNFQDTIEEFTNQMNGKKRRRRSEGPAEGWKDALYSALEAFGYGTEVFQPASEPECLGNITQEKDVEQPDFRQMNNAISKDTFQDTSDQNEMPSNHEQDDAKQKRHFLQDLAHTGYVLALWLVDTGDGRVSGEEGHAGVCRASRSLTNTHGWLGSVAAQLLTNTLAAGLSQHQDSRELLEKAGLSAGTMVC